MRKIILFFSISIFLALPIFAQQDDANPMINVFIDSFNEGDYKNVESLYEQLYSGMENPDDDIIYMAALSYFCDTKYAKTAEILQNVYTKTSFSMFPSQTELYASSLIKTGDFESAVKAYEVLEKNKKLTDDTTLDYASALYKIGQYEKCYDLTKKLNSVQGIFLCANSAFGLKNYKNAIQKYNQLLNQKNLPENIESEALFFKGMSEHNLWDGKKYSGAERTFSIYQQKYPSGKYASYSYSLVATEAFAAKDMQNAIRNYELYLQTAPNEETRQKAVEMLASVYTDYKMYDQAIEVYEPYLNRGNDFSVECMYKTAEIYSKAGNQKKSAETYYNLFEKFPSSKYAEDALFRSGEIFYLIPDYKTAINYFEKYTSAYPYGKYADICSYYIFDSFVQTGEKTKAVLNGKMFVQKYPNSTFKSAVNRVLQQYEKVETPKEVELTEAEKILEKANDFYNRDKKSDAVENYLLAAEYFRREDNGDKAALCLYTATECFVHLNKKGDAQETAKLLKQLYPNSRYANAVGNLLR